MTRPAWSNPATSDAVNSVASPPGIGRTLATTQITAPPFGFSVTPLRPWLCLARRALRAIGTGGGAFGGAVAFRLAESSGTFAQQVGHCIEPVDLSADTSQSHAGQWAVTGVVWHAEAREFGTQLSDTVRRPPFRSRPHSENSLILSASLPGDRPHVEQL